MTDKLNKGEWSEVYAFIKIAGEGKLNVGDSDLNIKTNESYKIFKIIKEDDDRVLEITNDDVIIKDVDEKLKIIEINKQDFKNLSKKLLNTIKSSTKKTFEANTVKEFLNNIGITQLKGSCNKKPDIVLDVQKNIDLIRRKLNFSIKSQIGNPATILNASQKTNFIYDVVDIELSDQQIDELNGKNPKTIINSILSQGGKLKYSRINDATFESNIKSIDSLLPEILSELLVYTYKSGIKGVHEVFKNVELRIPAGYTNDQFYNYALKRIKEMIYLSATTMITNDDFYNGERINGGIIIVNVNGELICYDLYNIDDFKEYLYKNMKFESPSRSRHQYAKIYRENNDLKFKLNLQIRYK